MKVRVHRLTILTKQESVSIEFGADVTFIHGPVGQGKSSAVRLVDYCLGGDLERTPAIRSEFVAAQLSVTLGEYEVLLDRGVEGGAPVRVTWSHPSGSSGSLSAPLDSKGVSILTEDVQNLSDLIFHFCGVQPVKVRRSKSDPESALVRLSFRDLMWYCFLEQHELDSSFFQMQHPFKANKSKDVMRFITGLYSDRMNELESGLGETQQSQRAKREAVSQIRQFMGQFQLASQADYGKELEKVKSALGKATEERRSIDENRKSATHAADPIRTELRALVKELNDVETGIDDLEVRVRQQEALKAELITTKMKASRAVQASVIFDRVEYVACPRCSTPIAESRKADSEHCFLCAQVPSVQAARVVVNSVELGKDLDGRIDDLTESTDRHKRELAAAIQRRRAMERRRSELDGRLRESLEQYDTAYVSAARAVDAKVAQLKERLRSTERLAQMPAAIKTLEDEAARLQADIDRLKQDLENERLRLVSADKNIKAIADSFKSVMLEVGFPGVYPDDIVHLDPRTWMPYVKHKEQEWTFIDAGSGGKKTLFNVCYAIAVHRVALREGLPLPTLMLIDSPTKNITSAEDPELFNALYRETYRLVTESGGKLQLILVDSHLVPPIDFKFNFHDHRMPPPLIPYYEGP